MISRKEKNIIIEIAKKYNAKKIIIFGSASESTKDYKDIDVAVEGISDRLFFQFYSELIFRLPKPVDLVDLSKKSKLTDIIKEEGLVIYG